MRSMSDVPTAGQRRGLFQSRPHAPTMSPEIASGRRSLAFGDRSADLFVPDHDLQERPLPLLVAMHGASGVDGGLVAAAIDRARIGKAIVVAPKSVGSSWDMLRGGYGPDVAFIDYLLDWSMARFPVDARRIGIGGFSDGASYALSLGLMNGNLFAHVLAFSPGFILPGPRAGRPRIFVSHGRSDHILPIESCGRRIASELRRQGYDVAYREFDGDHIVPAAIADAGMHRFLGD